MDIYDPKYWDALSDDQVKQQMFGAHVGSEVYERAKHVLDERARKQLLGARAEQTPQSTPPPVDFSSVKSIRLRKIAERDWGECWRALQARCWKSTLILSGGILETVLLSQLMSRRKKALATAAGKQANRDITKWTLGKIVEVAKELGLLRPAIEMLPSPMKDYRNLAHPGDEIREGLSFSEAEARAAFHTLQSIMRQLTKSSSVPTDSRIV